MNNNYPFITVSDIAKDLGITRQRVHQIINTKDFETQKIGHMVVIDKRDYALYKKRKLRRDLANAAGRKETKFIRTAIHDTVCKTCGAFAVTWKGTTACKAGHKEVKEFIHEK